MFRKLLFFSLIFASLEAFELDSWIGHTEGKGLGYSQGFTSFELFLSEKFSCERIAPFVDVQYNIFNRGKAAWNLGLGGRLINTYSNQIWGVNFYYDDRNKPEHHYYQLGCGIEILGENWEVHVNGYLPVCRTKTPIYTLNYDFRSGFLAIAREQMAMRGVDSEVGYHFSNRHCHDLYIGLGPYFYEAFSEKTKNAWNSAYRRAPGGRLRAKSVFLTYFELEATTCYDSLFKWTAQAQIALNIPFGCDTPSKPWCIDDRLTQKVIRNPIIVVDTLKRRSTDPLILDPEHKP